MLNNLLWHGLQMAACGDRKELVGQGFGSHEGGTLENISLDFSLLDFMQAA